MHWVFRVNYFCMCLDEFNGTLWYMFLPFSFFYSAFLCTWNMAVPRDLKDSPWNMNMFGMLHFFFCCFFWWTWEEEVMIAGQYAISLMRLWKQIFVNLFSFETNNSFEYNILSHSFSLFILYNISPAWN